MKALVDMLSGFFTLVDQIVDFIVNLFSDLLYVITLVGSFMMNIPDYFGWLPTACISMIVTVFGVVLVYKIVGRE